MPTTTTNPSLDISIDPSDDLYAEISPDPSPSHSPNQPANDSSSKPSGISGSALKIIAVVTMVIDHFSYLYVGGWTLRRVVQEAMMNGNQVDPFFSNRLRDIFWIANNILRCVGGIAFPIFAFLLVEGFIHTSSVRRYAGRLALFALISEIPFDLMLFDTWFYPEYQNVFLTLLLGLGALSAVKYLIPENPILGIGGAAGCILLAELLHTDYSAMGVALMLIFYLLRERKGLRTIFAALLLAGALVITEWYTRIPGVLFSLLLINFYSGERGNLKGKYFFYWFYPVHLLLLWLPYRFFGY